jgi:glutathione S-transferase
MGSTFSLADIPSAAALLSGLALGGSVEGRKNIEAWLQRCRVRPAYARIGGAG